MTAKTQTRLNKTLAHLRQAHQLLDGISLSDGPAVFDTCRNVHAALALQVKGLTACVAPKRPKKTATP